jgi:DNA-binding SARP family transcriptional activator
MVAELLAARLDDLDEPAYRAVRREVAFRADRWLPGLRSQVDAPRPSLRAARLLEEVGEAEDILRLRRASKGARAGTSERELGRALARRLAPKVFVEDQGRLVIRIGGVPLAIRTVRRKVLALLCLLLTKHGFAAPRDEILEALWPNLDPRDALNSLNQTLYFLRRVFEPVYSDDVSPGYVHHDSELVWLDPELVDSRSAFVGRLLKQVGTPPQPSQIAEIVASYQGKFALDFAYEEWSAAHRETQHAAYLRVIEEGIRLDVASGDFHRGIETARAAIGIDPAAQPIEQALLRLYKLAGAHAAASEQYAHYAAQFRADLDTEAPPLDLI